MLLETVHSSYYESSILISSISLLALILRPHQYHQHHHHNISNREETSSSSSSSSSPLIDGYHSILSQLHHIAVLTLQQLIPPTTLHNQIHPHPYNTKDKRISRHSKMIINDNRNIDPDAIVKYQSGIDLFSLVCIAHSLLTYLLHDHHNHNHHHHEEKEHKLPQPPVVLVKDLLSNTHSFDGSYQSIDANMEKDVCHCLNTLHFPSLMDSTIHSELVITMIEELKKRYLINSGIHNMKHDALHNDGNHHQMTIDSGCMGNQTSSLVSMMNRKSITVDKDTAMMVFSNNNNDDYDETSRHLNSNRYDYQSSSLSSSLASPYHSNVYHPDWSTRKQGYDSVSSEFDSFHSSLNPDLYDKDHIYPVSTSFSNTIDDDDSLATNSSSSYIVIDPFAVSGSTQQSTLTLDSITTVTVTFPPRNNNNILSTDDGGSEDPMKKSLQRIKKNPNSRNSRYRSDTLLHSMDETMIGSAAATTTTPLSSRIKDVSTDNYDGMSPPTTTSGGCTTATTTVSTTPSSFGSISRARSRRLRLTSDSNNNNNNYNNIMDSQHDRGILSIDPLMSSMKMSSDVDIGVFHDDYEQSDIMKSSYNHHPDDVDKKKENNSMMMMMMMVDDDDDLNDDREDKRSHTSKSSSISRHRHDLNIDVPSPLVSRSVDYTSPRSVDYTSPRSPRMINRSPRSPRKENGISSTSTPSEIVYEYIDTADIQPSQAPLRDLHQSIKGLEVQDWPDIFYTLNTIRSLALHHPTILTIDSNAMMLHSIVGLVMKRVDNLRSSLVKNALLTITDMFRGLGKQMDSNVVAIVPGLLKVSFIIIMICVCVCVCVCVCE